MDRVMCIVNHFALKNHVQLFTEKNNPKQIRIHSQSDDVFVLSRHLEHSAGIKDLYQIIMTTKLCRNRKSSERWSGGVCSFDLRPEGMANACILFGKNQSCEGRGYVIS